MAGGHLQSRFDNDVYQAIKKLEDTVNDGRPFKTSTQIYDAIKKSNSHLGRQKKKPLVDAIERALAFRRSELEDSEDSEAAIEELQKEERETGFLINKQLTRHWDVKPIQLPRSTIDERGDRPAKRKRAQGESGDDQDRPSGNETTSNPVKTNGVVKDDGLGDKSEQGTAQTLKKVKKATRFQVEHRPESMRLGGVAEIYAELFTQLDTILKYPHVWTSGTKKMTTGIVINGPMGVGKRSLIRSLAAQLEIPIINLDQCFAEPERMEKSLTEAFEEAQRLAPSIMLIESLDKHAPKLGSTGHSDHHTRATGLLIQQISRLRRSVSPDRYVLVMATTSNMDDISHELLTTNLFESTVQMRVPDVPAREDIFKVIMEDERRATDVDYSQLAKLTHGFIAADIESIVKKAVTRASIRLRQADINATARHDDNMNSEDQHMTDTTSILTPILTPIPPSHEEVTMEDLRVVIKDFTPSLRKEGFTVIPDVSWDQVGALQQVRDQMQMSIIGPIKNPGIYEAWGLMQPAGVLLWGPPGCGKTLVAQAVANEAQASFILINGPEILNKYVGESERAVREVFQRARASTPCILFFDEIDSIAISRSGASHEASSRIVATLLAELDGVNNRRGVYVIGTTNRPDKIDSAMLRPGRLSVRMFVDLPTEDERVDILSAIFKSNHPRATDAELARLGAVAKDPRCRDFSGADLQGLRVKAAGHGMRRWNVQSKAVPEVEDEDWEYALAKARRSVLNPESFRQLERKLRDE